MILLMKFLAFASIQHRKRLRKSRDKLPPQETRKARIASYYTLLDAIANSRTPPRRLSGPSEVVYCHIKNDIIAYYINILISNHA
jgi:hypothetical protein